MHPSTPSYSSVSAATAIGDPSYTKPWMTLSILAVLFAAYGCEMYFSLGKLVDFAPSTETLVALGGFNRDLTLTRHEWYRFITPALLHAGPTHLLFNSMALFFAGLYLERLVGRLWFFTFFAVGALGCTLASFAVNAPDVTSVGASGGIMALFAALFTSSFRLPERSQPRSQLQAESLRVLVPSLVPLASVSGLHTDLAGHLGGMIAGAALAFAVLKTWPADSPLPPHRNIALLSTVIGLAAFLAGAAGAAMHYPDYREMHALFIPQEELPKDGKSTSAAMASDLVQRYPRDPRAHLLRAQAYAASRDFIDARFELEKALPLAEEYRYIFSLKLANTIRVVLAVVWIADGARVEAEKAVKPVCHAAYADRPAANVYDVIEKNHLCE